MKMLMGAVIIYALFFLMCFLGTGSDKKNMISYYSYPDAVQQRINENEQLRKMIPDQKPFWVSFLSNALLFTVVFVIAGMILNLHSLYPGFVYFLIVGEGLNLFDLLVIDSCWWRNTSRTKFKEIPDKECYRDMKKHKEAFIRGIPVFVVSAIGASVILLVL